MQTQNQGFRPGIALALALLAGTAIAGSAHAQNDFRDLRNAKQLFLRSATVDTTARKMALDKVVRGKNVGKRFVVQLDGPMTADRKRSLVNAGVKLGAYLPANAYLADLSNADLNAVRGLDFVRWADEYSKDWKIAPELLNGVRTYATDERKAINAAGDVLLNVSLFEGTDLNAAQGELLAMPGVEFLFTELVGEQQIVTVIAPRVGVAQLSDVESVQFVEEAPEVTPRNSTTRWIVQTNINNNTPVYDAGITGAGQIIGVMDGRIDQNHCSFTTQPNKILAYNASNGSDTHGTHVAATAAGNAGSNNDLRGIAYDAQIVYNSVPSFTESAMLQRLNLHHSQGARVHTNSWGDDFTTQYNGLARAIDVFSHANEDSLVLFAVTNGSVLRNPENSKNVLAVGATQDSPNVGAHCTAGIGPTSDGRRKPEIYAPGCSTVSAGAGTGCGTRSLTGTSMASPAVAGTAALTRQYYMDGFYPTGQANGSNAFTPTAALVKATLLNSTRDMTNVSGFPSNLEGWGRVTLDDSLHFQGESRTLVVQDVRNADGLSTGQNSNATVNVTDSSETLRITLVWTDAPGATGASFAPVNNIDLEVVAPDGTLYRGNNFSGGISAANGSADGMNNVEQVLVPNPQTGAWLVRVVGTAVNDGPQGFAWAASGAVNSGPLQLSAGLDTAAPEVIAPGDSANVVFSVDPGDDSIIAGSATLHLSIAGGPFMEIPATEFAGNLFGGTIPASDCGDDPRYFFTVEGADTGTVSVPSGGEAEAFESAIGVFNVAFMDNFQSDTGWTVQNTEIANGAWSRGVPVGGGDRQDPANDSDGSGQAFLTDPADGDTDLDGGPSILTSPAFDLSAFAMAEISYDRWYGNDDGDVTDTFAVEISDGGPWVLVENVSPSGQDQWVTQTISVGDFVSLTSSVQVRFIVSDNPNDSVFEAGVDAVGVTSFTCESVGVPCPGDCDDSGTVDFTDLVSMLFEFGNAGDACDTDGSGTVDFGDLVAAVFLFGPCP